MLSLVVAKDIVVDTSVVVSALIGKRGASREVLRQCLMGEYRPLISTTLFHEYEAVSSRQAIRRATPLTERELRDLMEALYAVCRWVPIYYLWRPNLRDADDNFLVELALAGNAQAIVTNNVKDFGQAELMFDQLRILTPSALLRGQ
ncbi:MAG: putative toxin-antitoxin system toxin component, PIN family [Pseudomonadota bacterium]